VSRHDILPFRSRGATRIAAGFMPTAENAKTPFLPVTVANATRFANRVAISDEVY